MYNYLFNSTFVIKNNYLSRRYRVPDALVARRQTYKMYVNYARLKNTIQLYYHKNTRDRYKSYLSN